VLDLYKGQFLVEFYSEWSEELRRQLEGKYLNAMLSLEAIMENRGEYATAIGLLEKLLDIDPYHEEAYCKLIKLQFSQGDKVAAEITYRRYSKIVPAEIGLSPQPWLEDLRRGTSITE
jgi:DNA-binding SARP family transcriptional activator